jgi:hypothetical protein
LPDTRGPETVDDFQPHANVPLKRAVRVSVSLSQTSRDPKAVLSVTVGRPNRPIEDALRGALPRWNDVLGSDEARELAQRLSQR